MNLIVGADHGGFEMKEELMSRLKQAGHEVTDGGAFSKQAIDYPDVAEEVARKVANKEFEAGILICGTGIGVSIAANKIPGIRAALCGDCFSARMAKAHNNANIITLGARTTGIELAWEIVQNYLGESFLDGKHGVRVNKIMEIC